MTIGINKYTINNLSNLMDYYHKDSKTQRHTKWKAGIVCVVMILKKYSFLT